MSSVPLRNSDFSAAPVCNARSKLSSVGSSALIASVTAYSRKSCCSRAVRLRAFSNSACRRASRSIRVSRSALTFCNSLLSVAARDAASMVAGSSSAFSDAGNSCVASSSWGSTSDFPFVLDIRIFRCLFRLVQYFVKQPCNIGNRRHGVLIVNARGSNHRQRSHDFAAHSRRCSNKYEIAHRGQRLVESYHHAYRLLLGIEIRPQQPHNLLFLFQRLQQFLQTLPVALSRN